MTGFRLQKLVFLCLCLFLLTWSCTTLEREPGVVSVLATEEGDVVLPCSLSTKENIQSKLFDWRKIDQKDERQKDVFLYDGGLHYNNGRPGQSEQFRGRVSHFQDQLMYGNASIIIRNTKLIDSGNYTCQFPRLYQIFYVGLVVVPILKDRSGENTAAALKPSVTIRHATEDWILLQCDVLGASLESRVEWTDSHGNILPTEETHVSEREGSYNITLQTTVTKTGSYRCVATQEAIGHQIYTESYMYISEGDSCIKWIIGFFCFGLLLGALIVFAFLLIRAKCFTIHDKGPPEIQSSCDDSVVPLRKSVLMKE